jgi:NDP-sugar pyrophosphorylase family protein
MQTVILAGGLGTRLGALTRKIPKPMAPVAGMPYLEHQLRLLERQSLRDVLLLTGYLGDQIESYFGNGARLGLRISYSRERRPLGTGGALREARRLLDESFLLMYGDSLLPIEYSGAARRLRDSAALGVIVVYHDPSGDTAVRPNVALDRSGLVARYDKTAAADAGLEYVEAGVSCFRRDVLDLLPDGAQDGGPVSFEQCVFPRLIDRRQLAGLPTLQRFYDIGTPDRLRIIEDYLRLSLDRLSDQLSEPLSARLSEKESIDALIRRR